MIDGAMLDAVETKVIAAGAEETTVALLRTAWPGVHFTYCMDDDIGALEPFREAKGFNIYLVTGREHCISFTNSMEAATGVVIACLDESEL